MNIRSDWCILHTVRSSIAPSQSYNLLVDIVYIFMLIQFLTLTIFIVLLCVIACMH